MVFLASVHLALFLALFLSPGNSLVSSWCDHSMLASSLWQCLIVSSLLQLCWEPTHLFSLLSTKHAESFSVLSSHRPQDVFLHSSWVSSFHNRTWLQATLVLSLVLSSLKSVCCDFSILSAVMPRLPALYLTCYGILSYTGLVVTIILVFRCTTTSITPCGALHTGKQNTEHMLKMQYIHVTNKYAYMHIHKTFNFFFNKKLPHSTLHSCS